MKNCDEMVSSLLERREKYNEKRKKRNKMIAGISSAVCGVLIICSAVIVPNYINSAKLSADAESVTEKNEDILSVTSYDGKLEKAENITVRQETAPVSETADESVTAGQPASADSNTGKTNTEGNETAQEAEESMKGTANDFAIFRHGKLSVYGDLYWKLQDDPDGVFNVTASYRPTTSDITSFSYEGKTLAEWADEAYSNYFEGNEDAMKGYKRAYNAYLETVMPSMVKQLSDKGYKCERTAYSNSSLTFYGITAKELVTLPLENSTSWVFGLAQNNLK